TDSTHLLDHEFHLAAFEYREQTILISLVQRMRSLLNKRMDPYDAFLRCQTHMMELANAYVENLILKQTVKVVKEKATDQALGTLSRVCSLFALSTIEQHKGWYLENGYLESYKTKAIRRMVDRLCKEVRNEAGVLVDAFAIPEATLMAPIVVGKN
ncbi:MAG: acyl-CoA dehydrogenase, partial [Saprospiraceae bacterium]